MIIKYLETINLVKKLRIKLKFLFLHCKMCFFQAWYEIPLQSSPVDCQDYSAHDNMLIQIGPSMCSISELMGEKNSKTTTNNNRLFQENLFNKVRLYSTTSSQFPTHSIHVIQLIFFCSWVLSELLSSLVSSCQSTNLSTE
jgi:hypothetical protein